MARIREPGTVEHVAVAVHEPISAPRHEIEAVGESHQPGPALPGAADHVVAHFDAGLAVLDPCDDLGVPGRGVPGHVGQRLGDDELGGRLDGRREPVDRRVDLDGNRGP